MNNTIVTQDTIRSRVEQLRADSPWLEEYQLEAILCTELEIDPASTPDQYVMLEAALRNTRSESSPASTMVAGRQYTTITEDTSGKFGAYDAVNKGASQRKDLATRALYTLTENAASGERSSAVLEKARISISRNIKQEVSRVSFTLSLFIVLSVVLSFLIVAAFTLFTYNRNTIGQFRLSDIDAFISTPQTMALIHAGVMLLCLAVPFVVYVLAHKLPVHEMIPLHKLRQGEFMPMFFVGLGVLVLDGCLVNYLNLFRDASSATGNLTHVRGAFYSFDAIAMGSSPFEIAITLICLGIIPAIIETFVFNGVILQVLRRRGGDSYALLMSSLLFALSTTNFVEMVGSFISCMLLGYLVIYSGSLIPAAAARLAERILFVVVTQMGFLTRSGINFIHYIDCLLTIAILTAAVLFARVMLQRFPEMFVTKKSDPCVTLGQKIRMSLLRVPVLVLMALCLLFSLVQLIPLENIPAYADGVFYG